MVNEIENNANASQQVWQRGKIWVEIEPIVVLKTGIEQK